MSRKHSSLDDPTSRLALGIEGTSMIPVVLDALSEREARVITMRFGLADGEPKTLDEIGRVYGVTRERIRQILAKCISKLREPSTGGRLAVMDGEVVVGFVDARLTRADLSRLYRTDDIVRCSHCHEHRFIPQSGVPTGGRRRKYCSDKCRQAAYRARRRAAGAV